MADYRKLKPLVLKWEGGYQTYDKAGCTMKGVTLATFRTYYGKDKTCDDLKRITDDQWDNIFVKGYWNKWRADEIECQSVANILVDWVYNSGVNGISIPQAVLGVTRDGVVGPKTLAAINGQKDQKALFDKLWARRKSYYESIAKGASAAYLKGWLNRLNDIKWVG